MSTITDILGGIADPSLAAAKTELINLMSSAQASSQAFVQSNANQLQGWLADVKSGQMTQDEFDELVDAEKIVAKISFYVRERQLRSKRSS